MYYVIFIKTQELGGSCSGVFGASLIWGLDSVRLSGGFVPNSSRALTRDPAEGSASRSPSSHQQLLLDSCSTQLRNNGRTSCRSQLQQQHIDSFTSTICLLINSRNERLMIDAVGPLAAVIVMSNTWLLCNSVVTCNLQQHSSLFCRR